MSSTSNLFKKVDSSDYIALKRQIAISSEYSKANAPEDLNPVKNNGVKNNKNFNFIPTTIMTDASNCLVNSKSYELERDYKNGVKYMKVICK
mgnify:FL=1